MKKVWLYLVVGLIAVAVIISGCGASGSNADTPASGKKTQGKANQNNTQVVLTTDTTVFMRKLAVIETNKGKIVFQLFPHKAPNTVANFVQLAKSNFFDGIKWHRVEPGYVIQAGDPLSRDDDPKNDGLGGPGYYIPAEINDTPHLEGTVAMAHNLKNINSAGSQFYICLNTLPQLDGKFTVFGKVVEGMDVVKSIQYYDTIKTIYIEEKP